MPAPSPRPGHAPKKRSVIWLILGALGLFVVLILVAGASSLWRPAPVFDVPGAQTVVLDDGTQLFALVTYGDGHGWAAEMPETDPFRRMFQPTHSVHDSRGTGEEAYVIWLTGIHPATGAVSDLTWWGYSSVVDQYGDEVRDDELRKQLWNFHPSGRSSSSSGGDTRRPLEPFQESPSVYVVNSRLRPFHTDQANFTLRLHGRDGSVVASFQLPVRHAVPSTKWVPEPLPATKSQGDLAVTLNRVQFERSEHQDDDEQRGIRVTPRFEATWKGEPSTHWDSWSEVYDSLGNRDDSYNVYLSTRANAWKLKLRICRGEGAVFDPTEQWQAADFPIPMQDQHKLIGNHGSVQGASISIMAIGGKGSVSHGLPAAVRDFGGFSSSGSFQAGGKYMDYHVKLNRQGNAADLEVESEAVHMAVESNLGANQRLFVRAVDDQGRTVPVHDNRHGGFHVFFLAVQADAKFVQPTFIVHDEQLVEFYIDPPEDLVDAAAN